MAKNIREKIKPQGILFAIIVVAAILRLWNIDKVPVSLFGDELDVGYQAYSILKTGKDYSGNSWPIHFQSLAEWRTPLYLYSAVPTVAAFGISPLGVRLPAAIFGILSILAFYFLVKELSQSVKGALIAAFVLAVSPWHIQYSRAGFEVTELLFFLILGLFFFLLSLKNGRWLWLSAVCFCLTPWIYSTAKLFTPFLMLFLLIIYFKSIYKLPRKYLVYAAIAGLIVGLPIFVNTLFGGGTQRFNYISVFSDPTTEPEVGADRQMDARVRGETGAGLNPTLQDKLIHNKFTYWGSTVLNNYFRAASFDFLFNEGDPNLRHSPKSVGELYKVEIIPLIIGLIYFFAKSKDKKIKAIIAFWIIVGIMPSAITRGGADHATRLIIILPPLAFLISWGILQIFKLDNRLLKSVLTLSYSAVFVLSFIFYQHEFWIHNPWDSERWWHAGWQGAIQSMKQVENSYTNIIITSADEPPWIFFAGWYMYPPQQWHEHYPFKKHEIKGFGEMSYIDKFSFGSPGIGGVYDWGKVLDEKTLYIASAKEVNVNLIMEPERTPKDLKLIKSISYPSGEPAFYLFTGIHKI